MTVAVPGAQALEGTFQEIVADELNLKSVTLVDADEVSAADYGISQELKVNARAAGPRLGKQVQQVIRATKAGDWSVTEDGGVVAYRWRWRRASTSWSRWSTTPRRPPRAPSPCCPAAVSWCWTPS